MIFFSGDIIHIAVFICDIDSIRIDIYCICFFCFQQQRCDRQDTTAAADVQDHVIFFHICFDQFHTQLCCFMCTCTENTTGIDFQDHFICRLCQFFPGRLDHDLFTNGEGFEIFLPVICPVFFFYIFHCYIQRTQIQFFFCILCCHQRRFDLRQLFSAIQVIFHEESDTCYQLIFFFHQFIGNIVPISVGIFQKFSKIRFIVDHQTCQTAFIQNAFHRFQTHLAGRYKYFDPIFHLDILLSKITCPSSV